MFLSNRLIYRVAAACGAVLFSLIPAYALSSALAPEPEISEVVREYPMGLWLDRCAEKPVLMTTASGLPQEVIDRVADVLREAGCFVEYTGSAPSWGDDGLLRVQQPNVQLPTGSTFASIDVPMNKPWHTIVRLASHRPGYSQTIRLHLLWNGFTWQRRAPRNDRIIVIKKFSSRPGADDGGTQSNNALKLPGHSVTALA